jgi:integrase
MAIYKRGEKWYYDFPKTITPSGKRERGCIPTARTKAQAEGAERKMLKEIHEGTFGKPGGTILFKDFVEEHYIPWAEANKRSWKMDVYRSRSLISFFGKDQLRQISSFKVESFKMKRRATPIVTTHKDVSKRCQKMRSPAAVNRELLLLSRVFRLAITFNKATKNPCDEVELLDGERSRERYMLPEEEERLMAVLTGPREHLKKMVILAVNTGLREMELLALQPAQVDFHRDLILIFETKTGEPRKVPLNDTTRTMLFELVAEAREKGNRYLFTNPDTGKHYTTIKTAWRTACRLAGISNLRFHDLRHTFGTRAADRGEPLNAIQKVMGHKRIETTLQYAHATDDATRRVVKAAEAGHNLVTGAGGRMRMKIVNG